MKKLLFSLVPFAIVSYLSASVAIVKTNANVRLAPSLNSEKVALLKMDTVIEVLEKVESEELTWYKIAKGYVFADLVELKDESSMLDNSGIDEEENLLFNEILTPVSKTPLSEDNHFVLTKEDLEKIDISFNKENSKSFELVHITLNALVKECIRRNTTTLLQKIQTDISARKIKYEEGILNPILTFSASKAESDIPNDTLDTSIQLSSIYKDDIFFYEIGVGSTLESGTTWDLSYNTQSKWSTYSDPIKEYSNRVDLNIKQPILKGFGEDNTLIKINLAKIESIITKSEYSKNTMDLVGTIIQLYWKLYGSYKLYISWEDSLKIAQDQLKNIENGLKYGKYSNFELYSAKKSISLRKIELNNTKSTIFDIQNKILNILSLSSAYNNDILFIPTDTTGIGKIIVPNLKDSFEQSIVNWPELKILQEKVNISKLRVDYSEDQVDPQLDLVVNLNKRTLKDGEYEARRDLIDGDHVSWSAGVEFSMPIFNDYAEQNLEMENLKYVQSNLELNQMSRTLNNGLDSKIINLEYNIINYYEYIEGIDFQYKLLEVEYQRFHLGKSSIVEIFEQQENLIKYKRKLFNNIINIKLAEAALQKATGILLQRFNIELYNHEGYDMAKDSKYEDL